MKNIVLPVLAGFAMLAASVAFAVDATDVIKAVDAAGHSVTLNDGKVYVFPASVDVSKLKAGDKVKITFTTDATGKNIATAIAAAT